MKNYRRLMAVDRLRIADGISAGLDQNRSHSSLACIFCNAYSAHERGTNENRIGVLRQYLPRRARRELSAANIKKIEHDINRRPMRCLDWKTPHEVQFSKQIALTR